MTTTLDQVNDLCAKLREQQRRVGLLNLRAGFIAFPALNREQLREYLMGKLMGARCVAEIPDPNLLALPPIDEDLAAEIESQNPDTFSLLGQSLAVDYSSGSPLVRLPIEDDRWLKLSDGEIKLPSGRTLEIMLARFYKFTNMTELKRLLVERLNEHQWYRWNNRPNISAPHPDEATAAIPFLTEVYGHCVRDGHELIAYGTVEVNRFRRYAGDPHFSPKWFQQEADARSSYDESVSHLQVAIDQHKEQRAKQGADRQYLEAVVDLEAMNFDDLPQHVVREAYRLRFYGPDPSAAITNSRTAEIRSLIAQIKAYRTKLSWYQGAVKQLPPALVFIYVDDQGRVAVNAGKYSKMGRIEISPVLEEVTQIDRPTPDEDQDCRSWRQIPKDTPIVYRDYSASGSLKQECRFAVPTELPSGMWALAKDKKGNLYYLVISYWSERVEIPEQLTQVREPDPKAGKLTAETMGSALDAFKKAGWGVKKKK